MHKLELKNPNLKVLAKNKGHIYVVSRCGCHSSWEKNVEARMTKHYAQKCENDTKRNHK